MLKALIGLVVAFLLLGCLGAPSGSNEAPTAGVAATAAPEETAMKTLDSFLSSGAPLGCAVDSNGTQGEAFVKDGGFRLVFGGAEQVYSGGKLFSKPSPSQSNRSGCDWVESGALKEALALAKTMNADCKESAKVDAAIPAGQRLCSREKFEAAFTKPIEGALGGVVESSGSQVIDTSGG